MDFVQDTLDEVSDQLGQTLQNPYVSALVSIFIIFYAGLAAPRLPFALAGLFDLTLFKILILALILFVNNYNPTIAILVAVGFFISLQTLSRYKVDNLARRLTQIRRTIGLTGQMKAEEEEEEPVAAVGAKAASEEAEEAMGEEAQQVAYGQQVPDFSGGVDHQVSGLANRTPQYMGPQGMKHPVGYAGPYDGEQY